VAFLKRQRKEQVERRLFYGETWTDYGIVLDDVAGAPFAPWSVSAEIRRLTRELDLPRTRFHDLRHARATQLLAREPTKRPSGAAQAFQRGVHDDTYAASIPSLGRGPPTSPTSCSGNVFASRRSFG
jgi:integrase